MKKKSNKLKRSKTKSFADRFLESFTPYSPFEGKCKTAKWKP